MSNTVDALSKNAEGVRLHQNGDHGGAIKTLTRPSKVIPIKPISTAIGQMRIGLRIRSKKLMLTRPRPTSWHKLG